MFVLLDAQSAHQKAPIQYKSDDEAAIAQLQEWLECQGGAFGHILRDRTTPLDLEAVLTRPAAQQFSPKRISGGELVQDFDPGIPDGAMT